MVSAPPLTPRRDWPRKKCNCQPRRPLKQPPLSVRSAGPKCAKSDPQNDISDAANDTAPGGRKPQP